MEEERKEGLELTEAQIAVHWKEEEYYHPSPKFIGQANASDPDIFERLNSGDIVLISNLLLRISFRSDFPF